MCGICGFNWEDKELGKLMMRSLEHRGPDGGGLYSDKNVTLGHRRLSIIDLSEAGKQPMPNEAGTMLINYNGEIYNFQELREELEKCGHQFFSDTDTEVILHGYEQWGEDVLQKLNGMFAFCIYDIPNKKMFLARDRVGVKPLYYYWDGQHFAFASEIKALLLAGMPRQVNLSALKNYVQLRYVPGEETLFAGIKKLAPGHRLILHKNMLSLKQYWDFPNHNNQVSSLSEAQKYVRWLLTDSVKRRLVADVPVGVYVSGGIDSAAITALASQLNSKAVKTFTAGFNYNNAADDHEVDELDKARKIAQHFNTEHEEVVVEGSIAELLPKITWFMDMPHGDPVIIPQFKLSQLAAKKVKVVLAGEGADELFGGYVQYKSFLQGQQLKHIPFKHNMANALPLRLMDKLFDYPSSMGEKGKEKVVDFLEDLNEPEKAYHDLTSITSKKDNEFLLTEKMKESKIVLYKFPSDRKPWLNKLLYYDGKRWLPNYIIQVNDRLTMANSIEGRTPFLDYRLVEYSTGLPSKFKIAQGQNKLVLREAMKDVLPNALAKKHAFFMPLDKWYNEELHDLAEKLFTPAIVKQRGYFNYYYLKKIWENYDKS